MPPVERLPASGPRRCPAVIGLAIALAAAVACRGSQGTDPAPASAAPIQEARADTPDAPPDIRSIPASRILKKSELTAAEIAYGRGPTPDPSVEYKPGVVIVDGGPKAIRSLSANGLFWTIDAAANGASRLAVGTIAFVTSRCVGRVLAMHRDGRDLMLLLGPVELTDIYERLQIRVENQRFEMEDVVDLQVPQFHGWSSPNRIPSPLSGWRIDDVSPIDWRPYGPWSGGGGYRFAAEQTPVAPGIPQKVRVGHHDFLLNHADGINAALDVDEAGTRIDAKTQLKMRAPEFDLFLTIWRGKLYARLYLRNTVSLRAGFDAAVNDEFMANYKWRIEGPGFQIPLTGPAGVVVDVRQAVGVETAFSARSSSFGARGTYRLNGDFGLDYDAGVWSVSGPRGITVEGAMDNMTGVSFGPTGFVIRHELTVTAGLGAAGFTVGPNFVAQASLGIAQGSAIGVVQCREAVLSMHARGGVGYTLSRPVVFFVNLILDLVRVPRLAYYGSLIRTDWKPLFTPIHVKPGGQSCVQSSAS